MTLDLNFLPKTLPRVSHLPPRVSHLPLPSAHLPLLPLAPLALLYRPSRMCSLRSQPPHPWHTASCLAPGGQPADARWVGGCGQCHLFRGCLFEGQQGSARGLFPRGLL